MEQPFRAAIVLLGGLVSVIWIAEFVDVVAFDRSLDQHGILPRRLSGLDGVLWAPLLHDGFGHVLSNTVPLVVLGGLVMTDGVKRWAEVTAIAVIGGGLLTWLMARSRIHVGASGLIFAYVGYLLARAYYTKSVRSIAIALVVVLVYGGGLLIGLLPRPGISWEGHLFGAIAGVGAAIALGNRASRP